MKYIFKHIKEWWRSSKHKSYTVTFTIIFLIGFIISIFCSNLKLPLFGSLGEFSIALMTSAILAGSVELFTHRSIQEKINQLSDAARDEAFSDLVGTEVYNIIRRHVIEEHFLVSEYFINLNFKEDKNDINKVILEVYIIFHVKNINRSNHKYKLTAELIVNLEDRKSQELSKIDFISVYKLYKGTKNDTRKDIRILPAEKKVEYYQEEALQKSTVFDEDLNVEKEPMPLCEIDNGCYFMIYNYNMEQNESIEVEKKYTFNLRKEDVFTHQFKNVISGATKMSLNLNGLSDALEISVDLMHPDFIGVKSQITPILNTYIINATLLPGHALIVSWCRKEACGIVQETERSSSENKKAKENICLT